MLINGQSSLINFHYAPLSGKSGHDLHGVLLTITFNCLAEYSQTRTLASLEYPPSLGTL